MRHSKAATTLMLACLAVLQSALGVRAQEGRRQEKVIGPARFTSPEAARPIELIAPPSADVVRTRTLEWAAERAPTDKNLLEDLGKLWGLHDESPTAEQLFELTIRSFCLVDPETNAFVQACGLSRPALLAPEARLLDKSEAGQFYRANVGFFFGRYLVQRQMFEEGLAVLEQIPVAEVVDPASLLFHKAVCQHHLLQKAEGMATIDQLLKGTEGVPVRYATIAALMQYDLEGLQENSIDEISRKMSDVERRLNLGRTGQKVQKREDEIIATLDEIIKKIEDQQGGGGGGAGGQSNQSSAPASDSVVKGSTAPGKVDPKKFEKGGEWGGLPPKARAKAKDLIAREFPAHYRAAIEEFTRKGANRAASPGK